MHRALVCGFALALTTPAGASAAMARVPVGTQLFFFPHPNAQTIDIYSSTSYQKPIGSITLPANVSGFHILGADANGSLYLDTGVSGSRSLLRYDPPAYSNIGLNCPNVRGTAVKSDGTVAGGPWPTPQYPQGLYPQQAVYPPGSCTPSVQWSSLWEYLTDLIAFDKTGATYEFVLGWDQWNQGLVSFPAGSSQGNDTGISFPISAPTGPNEAYAMAFDQYENKAVIQGGFQGPPVIPPQIAVYKPKQTSPFLVHVLNGMNGYCGFFFDAARKNIFLGAEAGVNACEEFTYPGFKHVRYLGTGFQSYSYGIGGAVVPAAPQ